MGVSQDKVSSESNKGNSDHIDIVEAARKGREIYVAQILEEWHRRIAAYDHLLESVLYYIIVKGCWCGVADLKARLMWGFNMSEEKARAFLKFLKGTGLIEVQEYETEDFKKCVEEKVERHHRSIVKAKKLCRKKHPTLMTYHLTEAGKAKYLTVVEEIGIIYNGKDWEGLKELVERARNLIRRYCSD